MYIQLDFLPLVAHAQNQPHDFLPQIGLSYLFWITASRLLCPPLFMNREIHSWTPLSHSPLTAPGLMACGQLEWALPPPSPKASPPCLFSTFQRTLFPFHVPLPFSLPKPLILTPPSFSYILTLGSPPVPGDSIPSIPRCMPLALFTLLSLKLGCPLPLL